MLQVFERQGLKPRTLKAAHESSRSSPCRCVPTRVKQIPKFQRFHQPAPISNMQNPILLMFLPTLYMLGACLSLLQFQVAITLIAKGVANAKKIAMLEPILPLLLAPSDYLQKVFGPPHKFIPQPTHVILVAIILAIAIHLERPKK